MSKTIKTAHILERTGIPRHKLYYLEQKGYIRPRRVPSGDLEAREYSQKDLLIVESVWKYLQMGFKHKVAYQKSVAELSARKKGV